MNLVGVSTLFITPRLRSSDYISLLSSNIPNVTTNRGPLQDSAVPSLRTIVLVDNLSHNDVDFASEKAKIPAAIDFREVLVWREDDPLKTEVDQLASSLNSDDVVNLQFTR